MSQTRTTFTITSLHIFPFLFCTPVEKPQSQLKLTELFCTALFLSIAAKSANLSYK